MAEEKKIIIDEDWKSQVEAEKEAAKQATSPGEPAASAAGLESGATAPPDAAGSPQDGGAADDPQLPPASLDMLVMQLATEAMMCLGQAPNPATGEMAVRKNQAKYLIDTIEVLKEKTAGNVEPAESQAMADLLHQLRMAYVQV